MERETGFGPATSSLARKHSTAELLAQFGAEEQNRTVDAALFRRTLYH